MRGSVWHIFNWYTPTWFSLLCLLYQNRFRTYNQLTENVPASCNPLCKNLRPSSNKGRVDNPVMLLWRVPRLCVHHQSSRIHRNKPLFPPLVYCSVVKLSGYCHAYGIKGIAATDENKKFHYLNNMGVNGLGLKIKSDFSTFVKYTWTGSAHFL